MRFQLPLDHQDLDTSIKERLEHNNLYKDETIFSHMSVFNDVDLNQKIIKKRDVFHARSLLGKPVQVSSEESLQSFKQSEEGKLEEEDLSSIMQNVELSGIQRTEHDKSLEMQSQMPQILQELDWIDPSMHQEQ